MIKLGEDYFEIVKVEDVSTDKYGTRIVLKSDTAKLLYGEEYNSISFSTGKVFPMTLAVDARCVYSYFHISIGAKKRKIVIRYNRKVRVHFSLIILNWFTFKNRIDCATGYYERYKQRQ